MPTEHEHSVCQWCAKGLPPRLWQGEWIHDMQEVTTTDAKGRRIVTKVTVVLCKDRNR